jgi:murein L,D-transpeptidase YafK
MRRRILLGILVTAVAAAFALAVWRFGPRPALPEGTRADAVLILKARRELRLLKDGKVLKSYRVALGRSPRGAKVRQGDARTPEGRYRIDGRNPASSFHLALHVSYPNAEDRKRARDLGVSPGGDIMIHGIKRGAGWVGRFHSLVDWTAGCIAVTDDEIEEIWRAVPVGTPVEIRP